VGNQLVLLDCWHTVWRAVLFQVALACVKAAIELPQSSHQPLVAGRLAGANGHVDPLAGHVDHLVVSAQIDTQRRVPRHQIAEASYDHLLGHSGTGSDAD
jgi:hypothetical protein